MLVDSDGEQPGQLTEGQPDQSTSEQSEQLANGERQGPMIDEFPGYSAATRDFRVLADKAKELGWSPREVPLGSAAVTQAAYRYLVAAPVSKWFCHVLGIRPASVARGMSLSRRHSGAWVCKGRMARPCAPGYGGPREKVGSVRVYPASLWWVRLLYRQAAHPWTLWLR